MRSSLDQASSFILSSSSAETHTARKENSPDTDGGSTLSPRSSTLPNCVHSGDRAMLSSIDDVIFENDAYSGYQMARKRVSLRQKKMLKGKSLDSTFTG